MVSAIITTHNRISLLPRAIESVFAQTYHNIECIVVSDNSSDGTKEYCESRKDIVFIDIPASESKGGNYARNLGIKAAKGEYVAFLDDDDYWLPEKIEKQVKLIENCDCGLVYCGKIMENIQNDGSVAYVELRPNSDCQGDMHKRILTEICTTTSAIMVNKSILLDVGAFDEQLFFWQEYEMLIRIAQKTRFAQLNESLLVYRVDCQDTQRLTNKYEEWLRAVKYVHRKHRKLYRSLSLKEYRLSRMVFFQDAMIRANTCGLTHEISKYQFKKKLWFFPEIVIDKIKLTSRRFSHSDNS